MNQDNWQRIAEIRRTIQEMGNLPTLPNVALEVIRLSREANSSIADLVEILEEDIALTSKILRAANSAYYGVPRKIDTVKMAVVILGMNEISNLVIGTSVVNTMVVDDPELGGFNIKEFWRHSAACAEFSVALYEMLGVTRPGGAYVAGLMHDLGKMILFQYFKDYFKEIVQLSASKKISSTEAELEIIGVDHGHIGSWLIQRWNLPEDIIESVAQHHIRPPDTPETHLAVFVEWADRLFYILDGKTVETVCEQLGKNEEWQNWSLSARKPVDKLVTVLKDRLERALKLTDILA